MLQKIKYLTYKDCYMSQQPNTKLNPHKKGKNGVILIMYTL